MIDLDELAWAADQLEPLAPNVTRLAMLVCGGVPDLGHVVEIVAYDEALTASLLRSANSSWSSSREQVTSVHDAVIRLGASPVLAMTSGRHVRRRLVDALPEYGLVEGELWRHSVAASLAAELLAPRAHHRPPPEAATAALLHDVGKLVMARFLAPPVLEALRAHAESGMTALDAEAAVLGTDHAELGGVIARAWSLPDGLVRGIREHGRPRTDSDTLVHAVYLADIIANAATAGPDGRTVDDGPDIEAFARAVGELGVSATDVDEVQRLVGQRLNEMERRFEDQPARSGDEGDHRV